MLNILKNQYWQRDNDDKHVSILEKWWIWHSQTLCVCVCVWGNCVLVHVFWRGTYPHKTQTDSDMALFKSYVALSKTHSSPQVRQVSVHSAGKHTKTDTHTCINSIAYVWLSSYNSPPVTSVDGWMSEGNDLPESPPFHTTLLTGSSISMCVCVWFGGGRAHMVLNRHKRHVFDHAKIIAYKRINPYVVVIYSLIGYTHTHIHTSAEGYGSVPSGPHYCSQSGDKTSGWLVKALQK